MTDLFDFHSVSMKKNRKKKVEVKRKKNEKFVFWTKHFEERRRERKISKNLIKACLNKGRILDKDGTLHFVLGRIHVVTDKKNNEVLITAYFKSESFSCAQAS